MRAGSQQGASLSSSKPTTPVALLFAYLSKTRTEQVTPTKAFLVFVAVAAAQPRLSITIACTSQVSRNHNRVPLTLVGNKDAASTGPSSGLD